MKTERQRLRAEMDRRFKEYMEESKKIDNLLIESANCTMKRRRWEEASQAYFENGDER